MTKFILNDSNEREFRELPTFVRGYIEAMFFTEECPGVSIEEFRTPEFQERLREGEVSGSIPGETGFSDLHPDSLERIIADCGAFRAIAGPLLDEAYTRRDPASISYGPDRAGRDFWFTRNRHGVGFWDRQAIEAGELGERLSAIAWRFGEVQVWFADHVTYGDAPFVHYQ